LRTLSRRGLGASHVHCGWLATSKWKRRLDANSNIGANHASIRRRVAVRLCFGDSGFAERENGRQIEETEKEDR
jgi:hypothetical protein